MALLVNTVLFNSEGQGVGADAAQHLQTRLRASLYIILAIMQLLLLVFARATYNHHRHLLVMVQRAMRALNLAALYTTTAENMYAMLGAKYDKPSISGQAGVLRYQMWMLTLLFQGAVNFTLPLKYLVWFQLFEASLKLGLLRRMSCGAAISQAFRQGAVQNCLIVQLAAYGVLGVIPAYTPSLSLADPRFCEGLSALWLTQAYFDCISILALTLSCTYLIESWAKKQYVKSLGMHMVQVPTYLPGAPSLSFTPALVGVALSALWILLEATYVMARPSLAC